MVLPLLLLALEIVAIESIEQSAGKIMSKITPAPEVEDRKPGKFAVWWFTPKGIAGPIVLDAANELEARALWFETAPALQIANVVGTAITTPSPDPIVGDRPQAEVKSNNVANAVESSIDNNNKIKVAVTIGLLIGVIIAIRG